MSPLKFVPDDRYATAPEMPQGRPPTRAEVLAYCQHYYAGLKTDDEIVAMARDKWAWNYIYAVNFRQWDKQPDWVEGDPVVKAGVPTGPFEAGKRQYPPVKALLDATKRERKAA